MEHNISFAFIQPSRKFIQPLARCTCWFFCSERWLKKHIANDWLAGTWFIYWGCLLACVVCVLLLIAEIVAKSSLLIFVLATGCVHVHRLFVLPER